MNRGSPPPPPQESGLSAWIGGQLHPLESVPPALAVLLITVVIAFFTEFASNTATIIIFLPVLAELVRVLGPEGRGRGGAGGGASEISPLPGGAPSGYRCLCSLPKCLKLSDPDFFFYTDIFFFFFKKYAE